MDDLEALKIARVQLIAKVAQLSTCRVCGDSKIRYEQAAQKISDMMASLKEKDHGIQSRAKKS